MTRASGEYRPYAREQKCRRHNYAVDDRVLKKRHNTTKLGPRTAGPYRVVQTHVSGKVTIELRHGVIERVNIRRIIPYRE
jgi:hypothetical protein